MSGVPNQRDEPESFQSLAGSCRQTGDPRHQRGLARVGRRPRLVFCFSIRFGRRGHFRLGGQDECLDGGFSNHDAGLEELSPGERDGLVDLHLRSEEHTSELQSQSNLVCRLLLEKTSMYYAFIRSSPQYKPNYPCAPTTAATA